MASRSCTLKGCCTHLSSVPRRQSRASVKESFVGHIESHLSRQVTPTKHHHINRRPLSRSILERAFRYRALAWLSCFARHGKGIGLTMRTPHRRPTRLTSPPIKSGRLLRFLNICRETKVRPKRDSHDSCTRRHRPTDASVARIRVSASRRSFAHHIRQCDHLGARALPV